MLSDVKKAAGTYATEHAKRPYPNLEFFEIEDAFLAGAEWQRERDARIVSEQSYPMGPGLGAAVNEVIAKIRGKNPLPGNDE